MPENKYISFSRLGSDQQSNEDLNGKTPAGSFSTVERNGVNKCDEHTPQAQKNKRLTQNWIKRIRTSCFRATCWVQSNFFNPIQKYSK